MISLSKSDISLPVVSEIPGLWKSYFILISFLLFLDSRMRITIIPYVSYGPDSAMGVANNFSLEEKKMVLAQRQESGIYIQCSQHHLLVGIKLLPKSQKQTPI